MSDGFRQICSKALPEAFLKGFIMGATVLARAYGRMFNQLIFVFRKALQNSVKLSNFDSLSEDAKRRRIVGVDHVYCTT